MRVSTAWAPAIFFAIASAAAAATPTEMARTHVAAVAAGDLTTTTAQYAGDAALVWVGGALNGSYAGLAQITDVWRKFKLQTPMQVAALDLREHGNPAGTTVTADVVLTGRTTMKIHHVMLYRAGLLVNEIWQIDPKLAY